MPMPTSVLNTLIKLRHMSGEEIREYFQRIADFQNSNPKYRKFGWTAKELAEDQEKWHGLKNEKTYSKHFQDDADSKWRKISELGD